MEWKMDAQDNQVALPMRSHTILGVCEAIGEDFGFNPTFLRIPFAASMLLSPSWGIATYLVVFGSRLLFPRSKSATAETVGTAAPANEQRELAKAA
jgi:phage shock protein C